MFSATLNSDFTTSDFDFSSERSFLANISFVPGAQAGVPGSGSATMGMGEGCF